MIHFISHQTTFNYETMPSSVVQRLRLTPLDTDQQKVMNWEIEVTGGSIVMTTFDYHGNIIHLCRENTDVKSMEIICHGTVDVSDTNGIVGAHSHQVPLELFRNNTNLTTPGPRLRRLAKDTQKLMQTKGWSELDCLHQLSAKILRLISYTKGKTSVSTTAEQAMMIGEGVCQDHAHAFISVARLMGFGARYVSGYLMLQQQNQQEASHAWAEVYIGDLGWVGFDVSNGISPDDRYVRLASGFDYADVIPLSGVRFGGGEEQIKTEICVSQQ